MALQTKAYHHTILPITTSSFCAPADDPVPGRFARVQISPFLNAGKLHRLVAEKLGDNGGMSLALLKSQRSGGPTRREVIVCQLGAKLHQRSEDKN
jgi:hypothetical protein